MDKMANLKHVKVKQEWKTVDIPERFHSNEQFEHLLQFEELTDYEIEDVKQESIVNEPTDAVKEATKTNKRKRKRKSSSIDTVEQNNKTEQTPIATSIKNTKQNSKKKKKRKSKKQLRTDEPDELAENESDVVDDERLASNSEVTTVNIQKKKKVKSRKKKKTDVTGKCQHGKVLVATDNNICDLNLESEENSQTESQSTSSKTTVDKHDKQLGKDNEGAPRKKKAKFATEYKSAGLMNSEKLPSDMRAWTNLFVPSPVLKALQHRGFLTPTPIQALTLPSAVRDRMDIVGAAETGSGKTLAFGIPILHHILQYKESQAEKQQAVDWEETSGNSSGDDEDMDVIDDDNVGDENYSDVDNDEVNDEEIDAEVEEDNSEDDQDDEEADEEDEEADEETDEEDASSDSGNGYDLDPEEEDMPELGDEDIGCVRVINNIQLDTDVQEKHDPGKNKPLIALILEPTRELAIQVKNHLMAASQFTDIRIATVVGGMAPQKQQRVLRQCPEIVIATPGRLWELIQQGDPHLSKVTHVHKLVIDEADRMVEKGHFEELAHLLELINQDADRKKRRQTFVFSATLTMLHSGPQRRFKKKKKEKMDTKKKLELLMGTIGIKDRPKVIDLTTKAGTAESLTEARITCSSAEKDLYLFYFLKQYPGRTLVFTNSKDCIRRLMSIFKLLQCAPLCLHADMQQRQRLKNLDKFSGNSSSLLIASDVAARGLDIPNVEHVIHYQVPRTVENYVHRSGRTARALKEGLSVMLVGPEDSKNYRKIIQNLNKNEDLPVFPVEQHYVSSLKPIITLACQVDTEDYRFNKKKRKNDWFTKAAEEIDMILDEKALEDPSDNRDQQKHKQRQKLLKSDLDAMLRRPISQKQYSGKYPTKMGKLITPKYTTDENAIEKVKQDRPAQEKMREYIAAHPKVIKKKVSKRKIRKEEKRKKKKMKMSE